MIQNICAIILKRRPFTEKDLILTLLCDSGLRQEVVVKGANGTGSKRNAHLGLLNLIHGTLYKGKNHLYLQDVRCERSFTDLKDQLDPIFYLQFMSEVIEKSIPEDDPYPQIYRLMEDTMNSLNDCKEQSCVIEMACFQLAHHLGYLPSFKHCSSCHESIQEDSAFWDESSSSLTCKSCRSDVHRHLPLKYRKAFEYFRTTTLNQSKALKLDHEELSQIRLFIPGLFTGQMQRPLKTLAMLG